jgi:hypothetical protein
MGLTVVLEALGWTCIVKGYCRRRRARGNGTGIKDRSIFASRRMIHRIVVSPGHGVPNLNGDSIGIESVIRDVDLMIHLPVSIPSRCVP